MGFKEISPLEAMNALADGRPVYRFSRMSQELLAKTSVSGFLNLRFAVEGDYPPVDDTEEPEPVEKVTKKKTPSKKSADKRSTGTRPKRCGMPDGRIKPLLKNWGRRRPA